ncbi:hypothetical protein K438DRAFT_1577291, partial [Mycena galopus ATCC 62051]
AETALDGLRPKYDASKLLILTVDIAHTSQIKDSFAKAIETFGKIDVVMNNVAMFQSGEAEGISQAEACKVFDINF